MRQHDLTRRSSCGSGTLTATATSTSCRYDRQGLDSCAVPSGVAKVSFDLYGAEGGGGSKGGRGGRALVSLPVKSGAVYRRGLPGHRGSAGGSGGSPNGAPNGAGGGSRSGAGNGRDASRITIDSQPGSLDGPTGGKAADASTPGARGTLGTDRNRASAGAGGGGGSSSAVSSGSSSRLFQSGVRPGNGLVIITFTNPTA
jgi:hypothetical protein